jgi:hypothetical protein
MDQWLMDLKTILLVIVEWEGSKPLPGNTPESLSLYY